MHVKATITAIRPTAFPNAVRAVFDCGHEHILEKGTVNWAPGHVRACEACINGYPRVVQAVWDAEEHVVRLTMSCDDPPYAFRPPAPSAALVGEYVGLSAACQGPDCKKRRRNGAVA